jgi:hypothetical protein
MTQMFLGKNLKFSIIEICLGTAWKLGARIFGHHVWQPKATKTFWSPRMAIESDKKLVT